MQQVAITRIHVDPSARQRTDIGDLEELAKSIAEFGQLQPIILDEDFNLIAGFRRFTAMIALGRDTVGCEFVGKITQLRAQEIELEENIRRLELPWQDQQKAIARLHELKSEEDPTWSADKTAQMIGMSRRTVYNAVELSKALDEVPELQQADTAYGAMLRLNRHKEIERRTEAVRVRQLGEQLGLRTKVTAEIKCGDALVELRKLADASVDMVISNPPYGVDIENLFIGDRTIYQDAEKDIVPLLKDVCKEVYRVLKDGTWFVWFYPTARLEEGRQMLVDAGFAFQARPCIWYKPNKFFGTLSSPYQTFPCQYETFFFARKGKAQFSRVRSGDVFVYDTPDSVDRIHSLQMPVPLWKEIIEIGSVTGELVVEPFAGSGSGGVACIEADRNYLGFELSEEYTTRGNTWLAETQGRANSAQPHEQKSDEQLLKDLEFTK